MKRIFFILTLFLLFFVNEFFAQTPIKIMNGELDYLFNERLSGREILALRNGELVTNSIGKIKFARINEIPETKTLISAVKEVGPNHLAEIIKILPFKGYENLTETVSIMLKREESYTKVPFSMDDNGNIVYLYADAKIKSIRNENGKEVIVENFLMKPLDYYTAIIEA